MRGCGNVICKNCHYENAEGSLLCFSCGKKLVDETNEVNFSAEVPEEPIRNQDEPSDEMQQETSTQDGEETLESNFDANTEKTAFGQTVQPVSSNSKKVLMFLIPGVILLGFLAAFMMNSFGKTPKKLFFDAYKNTFKSMLQDRDEAMGKVFFEMFESLQEKSHVVQGEIKPSFTATAVPGNSDINWEGLQELLEELKISYVSSLDIDEKAQDVTVKVDAKDTSMLDLLWMNRDKQIMFGLPQIDKKVYRLQTEKLSSVIKAMNINNDNWAQGRLKYIFLSSVLETMKVNEVLGILLGDMDEAFLEKTLDLEGKDLVGLQKKYTKFIKDKLGEGDFVVNKDAIIEVATQKVEGKEITLTLDMNQSNAMMAELVQMIEEDDELHEALALRIHNLLSELNNNESFQQFISDALYMEQIPGKMEIKGYLTFALKAMLQPVKNIAFGKDVVITLMVDEKNNIIQQSGKLAIQQSENQMIENDDSLEDETETVIQWLLGNYKNKKGYAQTIVDVSAMQGDMFGNQFVYQSKGVPNVQTPGEVDYQIEGRFTDITSDLDIMKMNMTAKITENDEEWFMQVKDGKVVFSSTGFFGKQEIGTLNIQKLELKTSETSKRFQQMGDIELTFKPSMGMVGRVSASAAWTYDLEETDKSTYRETIEGKGAIQGTGMMRMDFAGGLTSEGKYDFTQKPTMMTVDNNNVIDLTNLDEDAFNKTVSEFVEKVSNYYKDNALIQRLLNAPKNEANSMFWGFE